METVIYYSMAEALKGYDKILESSDTKRDYDGLTLSEYMRSKDPVRYYCGFRHWLLGQIETKRAPSEAITWWIFK